MCGIRYRELCRLKNPDKYPAARAASDGPASGEGQAGCALSTDDMEVIAMEQDVEDRVEEECPIAAKARALSMEDLSAVWEHDTAENLADNVRLRVGEGRV